MQYTHAALDLVAQELESRLGVHREAARDDAALAFSMLRDAVLEALAALRALGSLPAAEVAAAVAAGSLDPLRSAPEVELSGDWPEFPDPVADAVWHVAADA